MRSRRRVSGGRHGVALYFLCNPMVLGSVSLRSRFLLVSLLFLLAAPWTAPPHEWECWDEGRGTTTVAGLVQAPGDAVAEAETPLSKNVALA